MGDATNKFALVGGTTHLRARTYTDTLQDPWFQRTQAILDPIAAAEKDNALTYEAALSAQQRFEANLDEFTKNSEEFSKQSKEHQTVVEQARAKLTPIVEAWRTSLTNTLGKLKPPDTATGAPDSSLTPPTMDSVAAQQGSTPLRLAQGAAEQQRKRALSARGHQQTILGGGVGRTGQKASTLLGY